MPNTETLYHASGGVATITLNRPDKLNAWTAVMESEVRGHFGEAEKDDNVRVIILTGAGRGFCAGADMSLLSGVAEKGLDERGREQALRNSSGENKAPECARDFSRKYSYFPFDRETGSSAPLRTVRRPGPGYQPVLRYSVCVGCREVQHCIFAPRIDRRIRPRVDASSAGGTCQRLGPAVFRANGRCGPRQWMGLGESGVSCRTFFWIRCGERAANWRRM